LHLPPKLWRANSKFAIKDEEVYVLEVNPRAWRTVPFVSKAIGVPLAKLAAKVMAGKTLSELGFTREVIPAHYSVKEAVFPFIRFPGIDITLGPEMKATGEVMGSPRISVWRTPNRRWLHNRRCQPEATFF
jgi:carbamoyl-phosphate synthase large subunit